MRNSPAVLLALSVLVGAAGCAAKAERVQLTVGSGVFTVEVARTEAQRELGLMHRRKIGAREGMLFVFDSDQHLSFWMKDTLVPLSIAFLSSEGRILQIEDMEPLSLKAIRSQLSARYALELQKGACSEVGAAVGDTIVLPEGFR
jgi:hypothetical protein